MSKQVALAGPTRREFAASTAAAAAAFAVPTLLIRKVSADGDSGGVIRAGLIGCGGRGTGAADNLLEADPGVELVAMGDMFPDRLETSFKTLGDPHREGGALKGFKVTKEKCFTGWDAYKQVIDSGVDLVLLTTPPGFRPIHAAYAVEKKKHVFAEKPIAVDPVGVRKFIALGEAAAKQGTGILAGTQYRHNFGFIETIKRIHAGEIGDLRTVRAYYNSNGVWHHPRQPGQSDMEWQLRNWYYFDWLCGDHWVEQHLHTLDVTDWVVGARPVRAVGVGGRQQRVGEEYGNIWDHFCVDYEYPNGLHVMSMARHWKDTDSLVGAYAVGATGEAEIYKYKITGKNPWRYDDSNLPNQYVQEHRDNIASLRAGKPLNESRQVAESTLTAILGRQAAYTGKMITWDEIMKSELDYSPPKYEFGPLPVRPVPIPGKTA